MKKALITAALAVFSAVFTFSVSALDSTAPDIKAIQARGVLKVGVKVDVPKFGYRDPKTNKVNGFEIDLAKGIAQKIFGDENKLDVQPVTAKTRGPLLDNGEIDLVIATFTVTEERKKTYNFSDPYFTDGIGLLVKKASGFKSLKDLNGKRIGVAQSATTKKAIQDVAAQQGLKIEFSEFNTYPEIKAALESGRVDCFSVDTAILWGYVDAKTAILPDRFSPQNYGVASKKGNDALAKIVNDYVNELKTSGQMEKLLEKWELK